MSARNPEFARFFFIHEHFERFLTTEHRRTGAWWYFLPMLAVGLLPWTGVFLWGLRAQLARGAGAAGSFAWIAVLPDLVRVRARVLQHFGLEAAVVHPADLSGRGAGARGRSSNGCRRARSPRSTALIAATTIVLWLGSIFGWAQIADAFADARTPRALFEALGRWVRLALGIAAAGYVLAWIAFRRELRAGQDGRHRRAVRGDDADDAGGLYRARTCFARRARRRISSTVLENAANPPYDRSAPFFQVRMYDQTLPFYLERTTTLVEYRDELGLGLDAEPELGIAREADWIARWRALPQGYALMAPDTHDEFAVGRRSDARDRVRPAARARRAPLTARR